MQKITGFTILNISIRGFKGFREQTEFEFGDMTIIKGANGLGKSSIADAIAYTFTGTSFFGEKVLDRLHNSVITAMEVSVRLADENGEVHTMTRTHDNDTTTITLDGYNVRQTDINEVFGDRDMFLAMFNPLYLIDTIGSDGKEILERLLPPVRHESVLEALPEFISSELQDESLLSPETFLKNKLAEIKRTESELAVLRTQAEFLSSSGSMSELVDRRAKIAETRPDDLERKLLKEYQDLRTEIAVLESVEPKPPFTVTIAMQEAELDAMYAEYDNIGGMLSELVPGLRCPVCEREVTVNDLLDVKKALVNKQQRCVEAGKQAKAKLIDLQNRNNISIAEQKKIIAEKLQMLIARLDEAEQKYGKAAVDRVLWEYDSRHSIIRISDEMLNLARQSGSESTNAPKPQNTTPVPRFSERIANAEKQLDKLKTLVNNVQLYTAKKTELAFAGLCMNKVAFQLSETVKTTGEIKDCFKFLYDCREFKRLSLSERIRAGLEVSELVKRLLGKSFPTFIDNSEIVCVIDNVRPSGQLFFARVEKGAPLSVAVKTTLRKAG